LRPVPGREPGSGEFDRKATPRVRRELTVQVVGRLRTEGYRLLHRAGEAPAKVGPRHRGQFSSSHYSHMLYPVGASRSPRDDSSSQQLRAKNARVPVLRFLSLRGVPMQSGRRSNPDSYNNVDHFRPWCILRGEGAGRSWAISETSKICLR